MLFCKYRKCKKAQAGSGNTAEREVLMEAREKDHSNKPEKAAGE